MRGQKLGKELLAKVCRLFSRRIQAFWEYHSPDLGPPNFLDDGASKACARASNR